MARLRFRLMGSFEALRDDQHVGGVEWRSKQNRTILKILLTRRGKVITVDQFLELLWPDAELASARRNLHVRISQLRRLLDPDNLDAHIHTHEGGYVFQANSDCWIDVDEFTTLVDEGRCWQDAGQLDQAIHAYEAAKKIYRGDFLEDELYTEWAYVPREALREKLLSALTELAEAYAGQGRFRHALTVCQQLLDADPFREVTYLHMMLYYYYAGEQTEALRVYDYCREVLRKEMDVAPMPVTTTIYEQIRDGVLWEVEGAPRYPPPAFAGRYFEVPYSLGCPPFVGREREYAWLVEQWRSLGTGLVLIAGEGGIGKTRLVDEFLGYARQQGAHVQQVVAEANAATPYATILRMLQLDEAAISADTTPAELAMLRRLFPRHGKSPPGEARDLSPAASINETRFIATLAGFINKHLPEGSLLCIDNAHHLDSASCALLRQLAEAYLVILAYRPEDLTPDHALFGLRHALHSEGRAATLRLEPLPGKPVEDLIKKLARGTLPGLAAKLNKQTHGNPFFLVTTLQHLFEQGVLRIAPRGVWELDEGATPSIPPSIVDVVEGRLHELDHAQRAVMDWFSIAGGQMSYPYLLHVTRLEEQRLLDVLDSLLELGLVTEHRSNLEGQYAVSHDRYAEIDYATIPSPRRKQMHRRYADRLLANKDLAAEHSAMLAHHLYQGGEVAQAVHYSLAAGEYALRLYSGSQAAFHFDRALQWAADAQLDIDPQLTTHALINWGEALRLSGQYPQALDKYKHALPGVQGELRQAVLFQICQIMAMRGGNLAEFNELILPMEAELAGSGDSWALAILRWAQGFLEALRGSVPRARQAQAEGWRIARRLRDRGEVIPYWLEARAYSSLLRVHLIWSNWRRSQIYACRLLAMARNANDMNGVAVSEAALGQAYLHLGGWTHARKHYLSSLRLAEQAADPRVQGEAVYGLGVLAIDQGRPSEAARRARQLERLTAASGDAVRGLMAQLLYARIELDKGQIAQALERLERMAQVASASGALAYACWVLPYLAIACLQAGQVQRAVDVAAQASQVSERCGDQVHHCQAMQVLGRAHLAQCEYQQAESLVQQASLLAGSTGCPAEEGGCLALLGDIELAAGGKAGARGYYQRSLRIFNEIGATGAARQLMTRLQGLERQISTAGVNVPD